MSGVERNITFFLPFLSVFSVCVQAQRTSAAVFPEGRVLGEGEPRRLRPEGGGAGELRGEQPVAQPLAALLPHPAHGKRHRRDISFMQILNREFTIGGSSL